MQIVFAAEEQLVQKTHMIYSWHSVAAFSAPHLSSICNSLLEYLWRWCFILAFYTQTHALSLSTAQLTPRLSHPLSVRIIMTSLHMHVLTGLSLPLCSRALCHPHLFESRLFGFVSVHQGCFRVCIILYCKVGTPRILALFWYFAYMCGSGCASSVSPSVFPSLSGSEL